MDSIIGLTRQTWKSFVQDLTEQILRGDSSPVLVVDQLVAHIARAKSFVDALHVIGVNEDQFLAEVSEDAAQILVLLGNTVERPKLGAYVD